MTRMCSPLYVYAMVNTLLKASRPTKTNRSSDIENGSGIERANSSKKAGSTSAKLTPCLLRFDFALVGSHSMLMIEDMHNICIGQGERSKFYDLVTYCSTRGTAQYLQIGKGSASLARA